MPLTDAELRAATEGALEPHEAPIALAEYDPGWPVRYRAEEARVRAALCERVRRLEHVGSTAVPGLAAKPLVDMVLAVADSADEGAYAPALEAAGYRLRIREPGWHEHRMFLGPAGDVHLHVFSAGCPEIARLLRFRDRLRSEPAERALYERTKRELAGRRWRFVQNYADAKSEVVEAILARAP